VLKKHLDIGDPRTKYISNKIQNEIIEIFGNCFNQEIIDSCNSAPFGLITDKDIDAATAEGFPFHQFN